MIEFVATCVREIFIGAGFEAELKTYGQHVNAMFGWLVRVRSAISDFEQAISGAGGGFLIYGYGEDRVGWPVSASCGAIVPTCWVNLSDPNFDVKLVRAFRERVRLCAGGEVYV